MKLYGKRHGVRRWGRRLKPILAQTISTDSLVTCPNCDAPMHLTANQLFECTKCDCAITGEEALGIYEAEVKFA